MNKATQIFLACPALLASTLLAHNPLYAGEVTAPTNTAASLKPAVEVVFERPTAASPTPKLSNTELDDALNSDDCGCSSDSTLSFSEQESTAAIQRYGCDCAGCINAVRQLQGKLPLL